MAQNLLEKKIPTSAGLETPQQTLDRAKKLTSGISADDLANPVQSPELTLPTEPTLPSNGIVNNVASDIDGIITARTEEADRLTKLREEQSLLADEPTMFDINQQQRSSFGIDDDLRELKDIQLQLASNQTDSELRQSRIAGAEGQTLNQGIREVTQEQREQAIRDRGLASRAAVLQGNIETASALITQSMNLIYQDRTLKANNLISQINDLRGVVDNQTQQLLDKEQRTYEEEKAKIDEIKKAVNDAVISGGASSSEINQLNDPSLADDARLSLAQEIIARTAREDRDLDRANTSSLINERVSSGNKYNSPSGPIEMMSFEEWAEINGGRAWQVGGTEAEMAQLRQEYESDVEVATRAYALSSLSPLAAEVLKNPKGYYDLTPTKRGEILEELAKAGIDTAQIQEGKKQKLSATQADDLVQAQIAYQGVQNLKTKLDELQSTGPVIGKLREMNPYDPQVVAIMAEINRIVPGLARGVFKEVGVLTDTDIRRYTETLANPRATKEQITQLHQDTMQKIEQSLDIITSTYSDLGYDLGKFEFNAVGNQPTQADEDYVNSLDIPE